MSEPAATREDPADAEAIAVAIARAERRLRLLGVMMRFGMALLRALEHGGAAGALLARVKDKAFFAISRAVRLAIALQAETDRRLLDLMAGILPAPKACRTAARPSAAATPSADCAETDESDESDETSRRGGREASETFSETESDVAFRARLEALEARLDQEADGAELSARETVLRLCRVMGLNPDWSRWLGDDWIEDNLGRLLADAPPTLTPSSGGSADHRVQPEAGQRLNAPGKGPRRRSPALALCASVSPIALLYTPPRPRWVFPPPGGDGRPPGSHAPPRHP